MRILRQERELSWHGPIAEAAACARMMAAARGSGEQR
jgi:hypothetical protein